MTSSSGSQAVVTFEGSPFRLHQPFLPAGDQPEAIAKLVEGMGDGPRKLLEFRPSKGRS